jgi:hypothetical protein
MRSADFAADVVSTQGETPMLNREDRYEEALQQIAAWSDAYPPTIFPPSPDLAKARKLLEAGGLTLDAISAHAMRHVIEGVGKIAKQALEG